MQRPFHNRKYQGRLGIADRRSIWTGMGLNTTQEIKCTWPLAEITRVDKVVVFYYEVVPPQPSLWESVPRDYGCASVCGEVSILLAGNQAVLGIFLQPACS